MISRSNHRAFDLILLLLFLLIGSSVTSHAESSWKLQVTPHFSVYTESSSSLCTDQVNKLESLRSFFLTSTWSAGVRSNVSVVLFESESSFRLYRRNMGAAAFYRPVRNVDYLVLPRSGACETRAVLHEYVHSIFHHIAPSIPLWLAEGLAEVYSSTAQTEDHLEVGRVIPEELVALQFTTASSIEEMFATTQSSSSYAIPKRMFTFYSWSWAATRLLLTSPKYAARFPEFLMETQHASSAVALQTIYGQSVSGFEQDLAIYHPEEPARIGDLALTSLSPQPGPHSLSEIESLCMLADLSLPASPRQAEIETRLTDLSHDFPFHANVEAALGFLTLRKKPNTAYQYLRAAIRDGLNSDEEVLLTVLKLQLDMRCRDELTPVLLARAKSVRPTDDRLRLRVGWIAAMTGDYVYAVTLLRQVHSTDQQFDFLYTLAYCLFRTRQISLSRAYVLRARDFAQNVEQQERAANLLAAIGQQFGSDNCRDLRQRPAQTDAD